MCLVTFFLKHSNTHKLNHSTGHDANRNQIDVGFKVELFDFDVAKNGTTETIEQKV